jgi:hypothetical protein
LDSAWLHWSQTGRDASPAEFITAKVFVKYCGPIAGGVGEGWGLEELILCSRGIGEISRAITKVTGKGKRSSFPCPGHEGLTGTAPFIISLGTGWK